ncbi:hypothetical protein DEJ64_05960 [Bacilli bacterium]|uniref:Uncharacterized protein n=1 Tax=Oceanobacillus caeni TaxID=405946 RepID=A0ABR5MKB1_9BACI|nr:hypothetical protein AFL42_06980 [Oceanobacillus caeni]PZD87319.1 hypothetical protein DEJ64_05960 [Bacilli bacterium]PZD91647.1 hypothetical protein DEJ66_06475 [Bacilli bacterium]
MKKPNRCLFPFSLFKVKQYNLTLKFTLIQYFFVGVFINFVEKYQFHSFHIIGKEAREGLAPPYYPLLED